MVVTVAMDGEDYIEGCSDDVDIISATSFFFSIITRKLNEALRSSCF